MGSCDSNPQLSAAAHRTDQCGVAGGPDWYEIQSIGVICLNWPSAKSDWHLSIGINFHRFATTTDGWQMTARVCVAFSANPNKQPIRSIESNNGVCVCASVIALNRLKQLTVEMWKKLSINGPRQGHRGKYLSMCRAWQDRSIEQTVCPSEW